MPKTHPPSSRNELVLVDEAAPIGLSNADLAGVNFTNTELNGANLTGANLTAVSWVNTTCPDQTNSDNDGGTCVNNLG